MRQSNWKIVAAQKQRLQFAKYTIAVGMTVNLAAMMSACTLGPDFVRPETPGTDRYMRSTAATSTLAAEGKAQHFSMNSDIAADWWHLFKSDQLDEIVRKAQANNPTLQASQASLRLSQDNLRAGYGIFYPHVNANAAASRIRNAPLQEGSVAKSEIFNVMTLSGTISYPLDIFGGERRKVEALQAQVDNQFYLNKAAYLTLSANIVNTCIARAAYAAQIQATEQLILLEKEQLQSAEAQVRAGTTSYAPVLSLRSLIASNEATLPVLKQRIDQSEHLLATLEGVTPTEVMLVDIDLTTLSLPLDLPLSMPSELVRQRPDILSAEAQLHAASANIGVATAAMFPSFSLSGTYGTAGSSISNFSPSDNRFWSIGPSASIPIFQGGSLWYGRQAAIDAYQQAQADYRQFVLDAFAQVADTLKALEHDAQILQAQADAQRAAIEALQLLQANYRAGLVAYVDMLTADVQLHETNIAYLQALAQRHQDTVALFVALGGGWWNGQDATTKDSMP